MRSAHDSTDQATLAQALRRRHASGAPGSAEGRVVAAGEGWRVVDVICTSGPGDRPFEERQDSATISLVLAGTFTCRSDAGAALLSAGSWLLIDAQQGYECSHRHGEGDRCLSFQFEAELFERLAYAAGARRPRFAHHRLPPLRQLAPLAARALAAQAPEVLEEIGIELAATAVALGPAASPPAVVRGDDRIAGVLRRLEASIDAPHALAELAHAAGLSPYHFLRVFKGVTGVTPHQWLLRARLRAAAHRLATTSDPVTAIALDVGFEDLSNFIRTFRAEFGCSPRHYRRQPSP